MTYFRAPLLLCLLSLQALNWLQESIVHYFRRTHISVLCLKYLLILHACPKFSTLNLHLCSSIFIQLNIYIYIFWNEAWFHLLSQQTALFSRQPRSSMRTQRSMNRVNEELSFFRSIFPGKAAHRTSS